MASRRGALVGSTRHVSRFGKEPTIDNTLGPSCGWSARVPLDGDGSAFARCDTAGGYRFGSDRGRPNKGSTLLSNRVIAQIRSPLTVRTYRPVPWLMPVRERR